MKETFQTLFASGHIVDAICAMMVIEGIALVAYRIKTQRGIAPAVLFANLLSGFCLLFALRAALVGSGWEVVAVWLLAALVAHVNDLRLRWRGKTLPG